MQNVSSVSNVDLASLVEAADHYIDLNDSSKRLAFEFLDLMILESTELPPDFFMRAQADKAAREFAKRLAGLPKDDRDKLQQIHDQWKRLNPSSVTTPQAPNTENWFVDDSFTLQSSMIALAYQLTLDGHANLRVSHVVDALEKLGRKINNSSWVIRHFASKTPPLLEITDEASGRKSLSFKLTAAGMQEGKMLFDLVSKTGSAKTQSKT